MTDEIEVIEDGDGVALIGDAQAIDRFLEERQLASRDLDLPRLSGVLRLGSVSAQVGSELAAQSGRWIKLSKESADQLKTLDAMKGSSDGVARAILNQNGKNKHILEFVKSPGARSMLSNPAVLAGAAGIMAQLAMQQTMDEITDYLAAIDAKVDDILRAQKDTVVAGMIGVDFVLREAMTIREQVGRVSDVTWSKVQATGQTIAQTQAYALRQLDAMAEKLERTRKVDDLADVARSAEVQAAEWLVVLAKCFQLQDAVAILELDRVLDDEPETLQQHRIGVHVARDHRRDAIAETTVRLLARIDAAATVANAKVLTNPRSSRSVVRSSNIVIGSLREAHRVLGIEGGAGPVNERRWIEAAGDLRDRAVSTGALRVGDARALGELAGGRLRSASGRVGGDMVRSIRRRRDDPSETSTAAELPVTPSDN
ncbi:hypothetical protein [Arthrobacter sp. NEB 688]|uniref:hypothetical protein n=1 Tax=Arthrobacter sp. NEB 688 TaxID=904039 RepID=UPI0015656A06|nr:hypothetical protein [Arthrobacter sp. NEB 688]QKE84379.1 hypothetical protein HL663_10835 [Arthrobacter sp. NEB 688]